MSQTLKPGGRSLRMIGAAGLAVAATALVSLTGASPATAAFTTAKCEGAPITGEGASFQNNAQNAVFRPYFKEAFCDDPNAPAITYNGTGSGAGRSALGANGTGQRSATVRFAGSDEPLSTGTKGQIEGGLVAAGDEGKIHQIPVAVGAIVPLVNFPNGCDVGSIPAANQTYTGLTPTPTNNTNRVRFTRSQFEKILASDTDSDTWGELFSTLTAIPNNTAGPGGAAVTTQQCLDKQVTRVVRHDESGSTFALKDALAKYSPSRNWPSFNGTDNRLWPNAARDDGSFCGGGTPGTPANPTVVGTNGPGGTPSLVTSCANGGGSLITKLNQTDGSVGYVDLSTAITNSLQVTPTSNASLRDNDVYFTQLPNGADVFKEATVAANGFQNGQPSGGARCNTATFTGIPTSTLGDWSQASGTNSSGDDWGICTLTYALAFDDNAPVYGVSASEEAQAATVADYLTSSVSNGAQVGLAAQNYASLPTAIKAISQAGADSIDWNKSGSGGGGSNNNPPVTQPGPPAGSGTAPSAPPAGQPPVAAVSNAFSVPRVALSSKSGSATFSVLVPAAGTLKIESTATTASASASAKKKKAKAKKIKLGTITRTVSKSGTVKITLQPTGAALKALKKAKSLKVSVKITFTPKGGTARSSTRTITLKYKAPAKKKASKKRS